MFSTVLFGGFAARGEGQEQGGGAGSRFQNPARGEMGREEAATGEWWCIFLQRTV